MTPDTKAACKEFTREFRKLERISPSDARLYAENVLTKIQPSAKWRVHLEMADLAKRLNQEDEVLVSYDYIMNVK